MRLSAALSAAFLAAAVVPPATAQENSYKMTTEVPPGITMPDQVETSIGTLKFFDGVPDQDSVQKVYDNLDLQHGVMAYLSSIQIASMHAMRAGILEFGPANTTVLVFETLMDSKALFLTPNTTSIYAMSWLDLSEGPMVIETPPNVLGFIDNAWFKYVVDFGNAGPDKGQGGKFLILPPAYDGEVPEGYFVARSTTYGNWMAWRGFLDKGSPDKAVSETKEHFRIYPLGKGDDAPEMNFINVSGEFLNTIHAMDFSFFEEVNEVIQAEPPEGQDPEILGYLAAIGIKKGEAFAPDARMKKILEDAASIAGATARTLAAYPRDEAFYWYPGESYWTTPFVGGSYQFLSDGATLLDARAFFHFYATGITPAMSIAKVGVGSQYAATYRDSKGNPLDGGKTYKVHLPPNVPAKNFWSFVVYDNQTRSMLQTDQRLPGISSTSKDVQQNADGSFDVWFGPTAPEGKEGNWIQTIPGKGLNVLFRLYGPLEPWFDKSWRPGDFEVVE